MSLDILFSTNFLMRQCIKWGEQKKIFPFLEFRLSHSIIFLIWSNLSSDETYFVVYTLFNEKNYSVETRQRELHSVRRLQYMHRASNHIIFNLNITTSICCVCLGWNDYITSMKRKTVSDVI